MVDVVQLTNTILDIVQQAANYKQLRKGANEGESYEAATAQLLVGNKVGIYDICYCGLQQPKH